jgi:protein-disulfide isomerase
MSQTSPLAPRHQRREAALAARRAVPQRRATPPRTVGIGGLTLGFLVAGIVVVALVVALGGGQRAAPVSVDVARAPVGLPAEGYVLGASDAPVTIHLYEDFQCPACGAWGRTVFPSLARNELAAGTARIEFHDIAFLGPESEVAARAGYAAAQQDRFWDMWSTLYVNQGLRENDGAFDRDRLIAMADGLGLDAARFAADLDSDAAAAAVTTSTADAHANGVDSTPTLIIDGQKLIGTGYSEVSAIILAALP